MIFDISLSMSLARPGRILTARYDFHDHVRLATTGDAFVNFVSYAVLPSVYWKYRCRNISEISSLQKDRQILCLNEAKAQLRS